MSKSVLNFSSETKRRKRDYSKNGCRECKRRKIKCDEGKPACWQCKRLMKECSYPIEGERVLRVSKKKLNDIKLPSVDSPTNSYTQAQVAQHTAYETHNGIGIKVNSGLHIMPPISTGGLPSISHLHIGVTPRDYNAHIPNARYSPRLTPPSIVNLLNESRQNLTTGAYPPNFGKRFSSLDARPTYQPPPHQSYYEDPQQYNMSLAKAHNNSFGIPKSDSCTGSETSFLFTPNGEQDFSQDDLNLLASDLNHIVNNIMFDSKVDGKQEGNVVPFDNRTPSSDVILPERNPTRSINPEFRGSLEYIPKNIPFDFVNPSKNHEKLYLEEFYNDFANIILPFNSFDESIRSYYNPARDILLYCASKESYLLAAILAQGAKTSYKKYSLQEDEAAYCAYLSTCLKLLEPALSNNHQAKEKSSISFNIEAVLLTVLLLTTANASSTKQDWRPHLKGAKDLLLKYSSNKFPNLKNSKLLIFCKFWFISFEILAGLSSKLGGSIKSEEELDLLVTPGTKYEILVLEELGLLKKNGFNLLCGYHNSCISHFRDLMKLLNEIRSKSFEGKDTFEYLRLMTEFYTQTQIEYVNKKCILSMSDIQPKITPEEALLDIISSENLVISWMDISHQTYVLASLIVMLTKCLNLPYSSPQVQTLNDKLISLVSFIEKTLKTHKYIKCSIMMIQWPVLVAGLNCVKEEHRFLIMKFFRLSSQLGSGSASLSLRQIVKLWEKRSSNSKEESEADDDNVDIVTY